MQSRVRSQETSWAWAVDSYLVLVHLFLAVPLSIWDLSSSTGDQTHTPCRGSTVFSLLLFYLFLAVLGLCCCIGFSLVVASRGCSLVTVQRLLSAVASLAAEPRFQGAQFQFSSCGSWSLEHSSIVGVHGLSCSEACGIFLDQGSNPCLLHWQVDSLPLSHQGNPEAQS